MHPFPPTRPFVPVAKLNASLLVETSLNGDTWKALGLWTRRAEPRSPHNDDDNSAIECTAMVTAGADSEHLARCVVCAALRGSGLTRWVVGGAVRVHVCVCFLWSFTTSLSRSGGGL